MARKVRRARLAPGLETLEVRALLSGGLMNGSGPWIPQTPLAAASTVLLRFHAGTSADEIKADLDTVGGQVVSSYANGPSVVALPPWINTKAALAILNAEPGVAYADADAAIHSESAVIPNDSGFSQQYGLNAIDAPDAWGITTGSSSTIVAVLDTGIDLRSPDVDPHLWTSPTNSRVHGWNFIDNNGNIQDQNGHGTNVSGILAAIGNNGIGVAGVDWNATIMPLKVLDSQGNGSTDAAVQAIYYAVQNGARVLNASWGGGEYSQAMIDAINYAGSKGVVFVTAAGNDSSNNDAISTYPASYRLSNELVVAATDQYGNLANFSNYGANTVDLAAPGVDILSTVPGGYAADTGTSMSTPFVSGTVALLVGLHPNLSAVQLVAQVKATVTPDATLKGMVASGGVVNAYHALTNTVASSGGNTANGTTNTANNGFQSVEAGILATNEFYSQQGGTPTGFVTGLYHAILGTNPDPAGLTYHVNQLNGGMTRSQLISSFQSVPLAGITRAARWYVDEIGSSETVAHLQNESFLSGWGTYFASGNTVAAGEDAILDSDAYYQSAGGTNSRYVSALFQALMGRPIDSGASFAYLSQLNAGSSRVQIVQNMLTSPEGHQTMVARLYQEEFGSTANLYTLKGNADSVYWGARLGND